MTKVEPSPLTLVAVLIVGLGAGYAATVATLSDGSPVAVDALGPWRIEGRAGAADADPYTRARVERRGEIPLAVGEGLRLLARKDSSGRRLNAHCLYRVGTRMPPTRYWTLEVVNAAGAPIANAADRYVLRSSEILRESDGEFSIWASADVHEGNWLPIGANAPFALALRLYDPALGDAAVGGPAALAPK